MLSSTLIFETFLAPACYKTYLAILEHVERSVKIPTFLLSGETLDDFAAEHADAGFINALSYVQLLHLDPCPVELIAVPLLQGELEQTPTLFEIVVRTESKLTTVGDLEGCAWAYHVRAPEVEDQYSCEQGAPVIDFGKTIEVGSQAQALRLVLNGLADATALDAPSLNIVQRNNPQMAAQLRVVGSYSSATGPLIVVASHVNALLKQKIQEAFLTLHQDALLAQTLLEGQIERFMPATNQQYQGIHEWRETHGEVAVELRAMANVL